MSSITCTKLFINRSKYPLDFEYNCSQETVTGVFFLMLQQVTVKDSLVLSNCGVWEHSTNSIYSTHKNEESREFLQYIRRHQLRNTGFHFTELVNRKIHKIYYIKYLCYLPPSLVWSNDLQKIRRKVMPLTHWYQLKVYNMSSPNMLQKYFNSWLPKQKTTNRLLFLDYLFQSLSYRKLMKPQHLSKQGSGMAAGAGNGFGWGSLGFKYCRLKARTTSARWLAVAWHLLHTSLDLVLLLSRTMGNKYIKNPTQYLRKKAWKI